MTNFSDTKIIDDLSFRANWNEATVRMNIKTLEAILSAENPTVEKLRFAIEGLKIATERELASLQLQARDRLIAFATPPSADILQFFKPKVSEPPKSMAVST